MQKQVEVKMDGSHLEPIVESPDSLCSSMCDKIMKNMVLTLTILGKLFSIPLLASTIPAIPSMHQYKSR